MGIPDWEITVKLIKLSEHISTEEERQQSHGLA
jgi:hypothetical protein